MFRNLILLALLLLVSCSGPGQRSAGRAVMPQGTIGLPSPSELRATSYSQGERSVTADQYETALPNSRVQVSGTALQFAAASDQLAPSDLAFAMYELDATGYSGQGLLGIDWAGAPPSAGVWVGLANWAANRWDWQLTPQTEEVDLGLYADYVDGISGHFLICVLSTRTQTMTLDSVHFGTPGVEPPVNLVASDSQYIDHVALSWAPPPSGPTPTGYSIWRSDSQGGSYSQIGTSASPGYDDTTALLDTVYWYKVRSQLTGDADSAFSNEDDGVASAGGIGWTLTTATTVAQSQDPTFISLAQVNGNPAIVYNRFASGYGIHYVRAQNAAGSAWIGVQDIYSAGQDTSFGDYGGFPGVAYSDSTGSNNIYYFRGSDADGTTWAAPVTVLDLAGAHILTRPDLADVGGMPAVAFMNADFQNNTGTELCFMRALDASGDTWPATRVVVDSGEKAWNPQLTVLAGGNPAIVYCETDLQGIANSKIMYVRASNSSGSSWQPPVELYTFSVAGTIAPAQLIIANGVPAVFLNDAAIGVDSLFYKRANDALGTSWPAGATAIATGATFSDGATSVGGKPAVAYIGAGGLTLYYREAIDTSGNSWLPAEIIESNPRGLGAATLEALGSPQHACIAYRVNKLDPDAGEVKFARKN